MFDSASPINARRWWNCIDKKKFSISSTIRFNCLWNFYSTTSGKNVEYLQNVFKNRDNRPTTRSYNRLPFFYKNTRVIGKMPMNQRTLRSARNPNKRVRPVTHVRRRHVGKKTRFRRTIINYCLFIGSSKTNANADGNAMTTYHVQDDRLWRCWPIFKISRRFGLQLAVYT